MQRFPWIFFVFEIKLLENNYSIGVVQGCSGFFFGGANMT